MISLKNIKDVMTKKLKDYEADNNKEGSLSFKVYFGTKNVEISVYGVKNVLKRKTNGDEYEGPIDKKLLSVSAKIENLIHNQGFVTLNHSFAEYYRNSSTSIRVFGNPVSFSDITIEQEIIENLAKMLIVYWKKYAQFKNLNSLYFDYKEKYNEKTRFYLDSFKECGLLSLSLFNRVITKPNEFSISYGSIKPEWEEKLNKARVLQNELEELMKEKTTFVVDDVLKEEGQLFQLELNKFYFDNEFFSINLHDEKIVLIGENIEEKTFDYVTGTGISILNYISEQRRIYNLLNPPIKNIKAIFDEMLNAWFPDSMYQSKLEELDNVIGEGETEKECITIKNQYLRYKNIGKYTRRNDKEARNSYNSIVNDIFSYYCIKTEKHYWHILLHKGYEFWMYPTDSNEYPDRIHVGMKEVMIKAIQDN